MTTGQLAPPWQVSRWFNSAPLTLADLRGRVVVAHAFQMLCPGCAMQALPQMQRVRQTFPADSVAVIGLHTVFEHHEAQGPLALEAFLHEYR
jgi:DNA-binding transcriptional regulator of glucitol operon